MNSETGSKTDSALTEQKDQATQNAVSNKRGRYILPGLVLVCLIGGVALWAANNMLQFETEGVSGPEFGTVGSGDPDEVRGSITDKLFEKSDEEPEHVLDPALDVARMGLEKIRREIRDYSALLVKQERVNGTLLPEEFMRIKVRHSAENQNKAFYVRHVKPEGLAGQEAIWVENQNDGKLTAHGTGVSALITVNLLPTGWVAMRNNRYPITELGIETLLVRMIEKGERDRLHQDQCKVLASRKLEINGRPCTLITITHPEKKEPFEFYQAKIYIDDQLDLPIGYEGFVWPETKGGEPVLVERYFYQELKTNIGLTDLDFDSKNPEYNYR